MGTKRKCARPAPPDDCEKMQRRAPARNQHWAEAVTRRLRVLNIATGIAAFVTLFFGVMQVLTGDRFCPSGWSTW